MSFLHNPRVRTMQQVDTSLAASGKCDVLGSHHSLLLEMNTHIQAWWSHSGSWDGSLTWRADRDGTSGDNQVHPWGSQPT
jgi:hypothetical protein